MVLGEGMNALWYILAAAAAAVGAYLVLGDPPVGTRETKISEASGKGFRARGAEAWLVQGREFVAPFLYGSNHWTDWTDIVVTGSRQEAEVAALSWKALEPKQAGFSPKDE